MVTLVELNDRYVQLSADLVQAKANYDEALDTIWMLLTASMVFFMHAGFSLLEAGSVRNKDTQHILTKRLIVVIVGFLCWYIIGYAIAFGAPVKTLNHFSGGTHFAMDGFWDDKRLFRFWWFHGCFCTVCATIVCGAMAERTQLKGFIAYTMLMTSFIYPIIIWWGWSGYGWFYHDGDKSVVGDVALKDWAGGGLVHMVGGVAALCGAIIVGARPGRWEPENEADFARDNIPFCVLGTFFLWFGWYGFNPGSTWTMHTVDAANRAGLVAVNTTLSPCVCGLLIFFLRKVLPPKLLEGDVRGWGTGVLDVGGFCKGILAGLVAITAGCAWVKPWEAIIIGAIGALFYQIASMLIKKLKIDDVVDAFPVHGACGLWGLCATGLFGDSGHHFGGNGGFYGGNQFGTQVFMAFMITIWVGGASVFIMLPLRLLGVLRDDGEVQAKEGAKEESQLGSNLQVAETAL